MNIGIFFPTRTPLSMRSYTINVERELKALDVHIERFSENDPLPDNVDLYWDPRGAGGDPPFKGLRFATKPFVMSLAGAAPFSMKPLECYPNIVAAVRGKLAHSRKLYLWRFFRGKAAAIITITQYSKYEIEKYIGLEGENIFQIYYGVDHDLFKPATTQNDSDQFLLHISAYQPKKNVDRIFMAYDRLEIKNKPRLVAVVPGYPDKKVNPGIELIRTSKSHDELATLYKNAMGFVFPSIHETFGMPIMEAMACGCPVITSHTTACGEVAGDAALLVDPRSVDDIAEAMQRLIVDNELRKTLRDKSIQRASNFTWRKCAEEHLAVFKQVV